MVIAQALAAAAALGLERLDAQLLLLHALGRPQADRAWLLAHDGDELDAVRERTFIASCERRAAGEPLAYIVGRKEFHGLDLRVDARVLVPRPDTETLVDWAISLLRGRGPLSVIDLGTGSGAIALAIAQACPDAHVTAVDTSADALELAGENARALGLQVVFRRSSWLADAPGPYDLIVSNPPYVAESDPHLAALRHEPTGRARRGSGWAAGHPRDRAAGCVPPAAGRLVAAGARLGPGGRGARAAGSRGIRVGDQPARPCGYRALLRRRDGLNWDNRPQTD